MLSRPVLLVVALLGVPLLVVAAAVAYVVLPPWKSADVAVPGDSASPDQVVRAFLDAVDAHDCDTARAVMTKDAVDIASGWCERVAGLDDIVVQDPLVEKPHWAGRSPDEEVVDVEVQFDLDWRLLHGDASLPEGPTVWGYELVRTSPGSPWRIFSQGTG